MTTIKLIDLPGIRAFSTLRDCTDAASPYDGFNTCHYTGAPVHSVEECRGRLAAQLDIGISQLVIPRQTHSACVKLIDSLPVDPAELEGVDGLVTSLSGVALVIHTADCVPVVMADRRKGIIAAVHSGWRGTVADITGRALRLMECAGADCTDIVAAMGPCICRECFETGSEVASQFGRQFVDYSYGEKPHIDLPEVIRHTLIAAGVAPGNISMPPACSRCSHDRFFSARRLGINSGRTATVIFRESPCAEMHR